MRQQQLIDCNLEPRTAAVSCATDMLTTCWHVSLPPPPQQQVRVAIASQLHVMARQVPPADAARLLRRPLAALLRDSNAQVREALLAGLADTLQVRFKPGRLVCGWFELTGLFPRLPLHNNCALWRLHTTQNSAHCGEKRCVHWGSIV